MKPLVLLLLFCVGCASSRSLTSSTVRPEIDSTLVRVYDEAPPGAKKIGTVNAFNTWGFSGQECYQIAEKKIKQQAAKMGANALVITRNHHSFWSGIELEANAFTVDVTPEK